MSRTRSDHPIKQIGLANRGRVAPNAGKHYPVEILTPVEIRALIRACSDRAPTGIRNRALLVLLWRAGLRVSEALALQPKDLDLDAGTCTVRQQRGDRRRTVGLDPETCSVVGRWLDRRRELGLRNQPVLCTLAGGPMAATYCRLLLPRLAARAGIEKRVHPHALRHAHAAELAAEQVPVTVIRDQLGHSSLATTDRYLRGIAPAEVVSTIRARAWSLDDKDTPER